MERVRRVRRRGAGEEVRVDGLEDHAGARDRVRHDDVFHLRDVFGRRGADRRVGSAGGDEGGDVDGRAAEEADEGWVARVGQRLCLYLYVCDGFWGYEGRLPGRIA